MIFFHKQLNIYKRSILQYMGNNFKTSLVIAHPPPPLSASLIMTNCIRKLICGLTPQLISEYTPNSNFSANHEDNENDQDNENRLDNENEGNYPANKDIFKVRSRKKVLVYLCLFLNIFHTLYKCFNVGFEHLLFDRVVFFHCKYQIFMFYVS